MKKTDNNITNQHFPVNYLNSHPESSSMKKRHKSSPLYLGTAKRAMATAQMLLRLAWQALTVFGRGMARACLTLLRVLHLALKSLGTFVSPTLERLRERILLTIRLFFYISDAFTAFMDAFFLMDEAPELAVLLITVESDFRTNRRKAGKVHASNIWSRARNLKSICFPAVNTKRSLDPNAESFRIDYPAFYDSSKSVFTHGKARIGKSTVLDFWRNSIATWNHLLSHPKTVIKTCFAASALFLNPMQIPIIDKGIHAIDAFVLE